jgi:hypothetical protein
VAACRHRYGDSIAAAIEIETPELTGADLDFLVERLIDADTSDIGDNDEDPR